MQNIDKKADKSTAIGVLQCITGAIIFLICLIVAVVLFVFERTMTPAILLISGLVVDALLTYKGMANYKRASRYRRIKKAMDGAGSIEIAQLQSKLDWPKDKIISYIKNQTNHGYWPDSHLDTEKGIFMLGYNPAQIDSDTGNKATDELLKEANKHLHEMATAARIIEDENLTAQTERIIETAKQIYKTVEKHPDKQSSVRQLTNYVLPTTAKLITDYTDLQNQPIKSESMEETMQKIKDSMQTIEETFKKHQESIYSDKAMDISVEIDVLKKMMN